MSAAPPPPRHRVVVALGSNIDPERHIAAALAALHERYDVLAEAPVVRTAPVGRRDQPDFLNTAVLLASARPAAALQAELKALERDLGRRRGGPKDGPRTIDLDLAVVDDTVVDDDVATRDFLYDAVALLAPAAVAGLQRPTGHRS